MLLQKDIAESLNVSVATVSRSLRNDTAIPAKTRARVIQMASQNGYRPPIRKAKQSIRQKQETISIGVLINLEAKEFNTRSVITQGYLSGICQHAQPLNVSLNVHYITDDNVECIVEPENQPPFMRDNNIHGLILIHKFPDKTVTELTKKWPCVILSNRVYRVNADYVSPDNNLAMNTIVNNLHDIGHRNITFVTCTKKFAWAHSRFSGFVDAMFLLGGQIAPDQWICFDERIEDAPPDFSENLVAAVKRGTTAFVCGNDCVGYDVINRLKEMGLKVPDDISVTGFDAIPTSHGLPALTTFEQTYDYMGEETIKCLHQRIEQPLIPMRHISVKAKFVKGESIKPVRKG